MLAVLLENPRTPEEWERWSFHHRASHDLIRDTIKQKGGPSIQDFILYPISHADFGSFLGNNQQAHIQMLGALGIQSEDLSSLDPANQEQLGSWCYQHWFDHFSAENRLGISS